MTGLLFSNYLLQTPTKSMGIRYLAVSEATFDDKLVPSVDAITVFRIPGH